MGLIFSADKPEINAGIELWKETSGAILLDVRTEDEYKEGHIEGSLNHPLEKITTIEAVLPDKETPLFVHCLSGARSARACAWLKQHGYTNVTNIGGIRDFKGAIITNR